MNQRLLQFSTCLGLLITLVACGKQSFQVVPVKGQVICSGQPARSGTVTFTPVGAPGALQTGKQASGMVDNEGRFVLSTYGRFDGAIVGKHNVQYSGSEGSDDSAEESESEAAEGEEPTAKRSPASKASPSKVCAQAGEIIFEVMAGSDNNFTIELSPKKPK